VQKSFLRIKPCKMMLLLKESGSRYITEIAKESGATYVHTTKLLRKLEEGGFVTIEKNGKKRMVKLTEKGGKVAAALSEVMNSFSS